MTPFIFKSSLCLWLLCAGSFSQSVMGSDHPVLEPLQSPIAYQGESVEVTALNTLRCRYASLDFYKDLAFYREQALKNSAGRKPGTINMIQVFIKEMNVIARHEKNPGGKIEGIGKIPETFITESPDFEKLFSDFVHASSNGAVTVRYRDPIIVDTPVLYDQPQDGPNNWWFRPKFIEKEMTFLSAIPENSVDYMFFLLHTVAINGSDKLMWPAYGGMAWGDEEIRGARLLTVNDHELARNIHEFEHHIFDTTIQETEGLTISAFHGYNDAGYNSGGPAWDKDKKLGPCLVYYRDLIRYYYTRDMWERWQLKGKHHVPHETFSGKSYTWDLVKSDYWYKLPQLKNKELQQLTGLKSLNVSTQSADIFLKIDPQEHVTSPTILNIDKHESALNNNVNFYAESAGMIATDTGCWLFVKPQLMDFYVNALIISGDTQAKPLPVFGYILEGQKTLLVIQWPQGMPIPKNERSIFSSLVEVR